MDAPSEPLPNMERLRWRCRRGLLELDLLFEAFLTKRYSGLPDSDKADFIRLLEYQDQTLQEWLLGKTQPDDKTLVRLISLVRESV